MIELVLQFFEFGSPPFRRLVEDFQQRLMEEFAGSDLPEVIFTFVWGRSICIASDMYRST
jgi:hypothetical protein